MSFIIIVGVSGDENMSLVEEMGTGLSETAQQPQLMELLPPVAPDPLSGASSPELLPLPVPECALLPMPPEDSETSPQKLLTVPVNDCPSVPPPPASNVSTTDFRLLKMYKLAGLHEEIENITTELMYSSFLGFQEPFCNISCKFSLSHF